nr:MAG TPA_asm: hypothetical protein [Bacteriophage sp.]
MRQKQINLSLIITFLTLLLKRSRRRFLLILMLLVISRMLVTILVIKLLIMKDITKYRIFVFLVAAALLKQT